MTRQPSECNRVEKPPAVGIFLLIIFIPLMLFALVDRGFGKDVDILGTVTATSGSSFYSVGTIQGSPDNPRIYPLPVSRGDLEVGQSYRATCKLGLVSKIILHCNPYERIPVAHQ